MHRALQWLVSHDRYYRALGVTIDTTALAQLPQDGSTSHLMSVIEHCSPPNSPTNSGTSTDLPASDIPITTYTAAIDDSHDHLPQSFVPVAAPSMTEQEAVQQCVQQSQASSLSPTALMWRSIGGMPLNEFTTEGYFICAFPTGAGDFLGQRQVQVIGNYFKHMMQYDDGRFPQHPRFFSLSTRRCGSVRSRVAESMFANTQVMHSCPWMNCGTW